jgi:hypothetical protein
MIGIPRKSQGAIVAEKETNILSNGSLLKSAVSRSPSRYWNGPADYGRSAHAVGCEGNGKSGAAGRLHDDRAPVNASPFEKHAVSRMERHGVHAIDVPGAVFRHIVNRGLDSRDHEYNRENDAFHRRTSFVLEIIFSGLPGFS